MAAICYRYDMQQTEKQFLECIKLLNSEAVSDGDVLKAKEMFRKCLGVNLNYIEKLFDEIFKNLLQKKFASVFALFQVALVIGEVSVVADANTAMYIDGCMRDIKFFLYLINYISREVFMPDSLKIVFTGINYESIKLGEKDSRYRDVCGLNEYRKNEMLGEYYSLNFISTSNVWEKITRFLFAESKKKASNFKRRIKSKAADNDYLGLLETILYERNIRTLSNAWEKTLILLHVILNYDNRAVCDILEDFDGDMFVEDFEYQAIVRGEFELARDFRYQRKKSEERVGEDIIIKLLDKLIELQDEKCNLSTKCGCSNSRVVTFDEIASGLIGGLGVEHVLNILPGYLAIINKEMYEGFIAGLIRVCVLEGDTSFMVPLRFLSQIKDGNFNFKADAIYYKIYDAIVYNERVIAFAYLNILNEANNIGISVDLNLISFFKNLLENGNDTLKDEDDFKDQADVGENYYGVLGVGSLKEKIEKSNLGIESVCRELGICDNEIINLIRLIYARDFYSVGMFEAGDRLVIAVEKSKNKSDRLKFVLNDVRSRKKFLMYQEENKKSVKVLKLVKP